MLSIVRLLPKQANFICKCASDVLTRSYYTPATFAVDSFLKYKSKTEREDLGKSASLKIAIKEALAKENSPLFTEDLKHLLYTTQNDEDLDLLISALKKYHKQDSVAIFNYNFDASLMRLLYTLNREDKALDLFLDEGEAKFFGQSFKVSQMLMNKLLVEKRYDDVVKVFDTFLKRRIETPQAENKNGSIFIHINLVTEALLNKNNPEALTKAKSILSVLNENKFLITDIGLKRIFLLALQQKEPQFAYEIVPRINKTSTVVIRNLKILSLLDLNKKDEALQIAIELAAENTNITRIFYKSTLDRLTETFKDEGENKKKVDDLVDQVKQKGRIIETDFKESLLKEVTLERRTDGFSKDRKDDRGFGTFRDRNIGGGNFGERKNFNPNNSFQNRNSRGTGSENASTFQNRSKNSDNFLNRRPQQQQQQQQQHQPPQQGQNRRRTNVDDDN